MNMSETKMQQEGARGGRQSVQVRFAGKRRAPQVILLSFAECSRSVLPGPEHTYVPAPPVGAHKELYNTVQQYAGQAMNFEFHLRRLAVFYCGLNVRDKRSWKANVRDVRLLAFLSKPICLQAAVSSGLQKISTQTCRILYPMGRVVPVVSDLNSICGAVEIVSTWSSKAITIMAVIQHLLYIHPCMRVAIKVAPFCLKYSLKDGTITENRINA